MFYLTKAPLRVSLFGGGTDFPEYFKKNKGAVLGFSINKYIYTFASKMHSSVRPQYRISYKNMEEVLDVNDINHPTIKHILKKNIKFFKKDKWHFGTLADVPAGTGLGSSSAFTVSFLFLINKIKKNKTSKLNIAKQAHNIERNYLKEYVGLQDPYHCSIGGLNVIKFYKEKIQVENINISRKKMNFINNSMIMCYVGNNRRSSQVSKSHVGKINNKKNAYYLNEMYKSVVMAKKIIINLDGNEMLIELGKLLNLNWEYKKKLTNKITNKNIDKIINFGLKNGAYGAKLCGAGGGGFILFLVSKNIKNKFKSKLSKSYLCMDIDIDLSGVN